MDTNTPALASIGIDIGKEVFHIVHPRNFEQLQYVESAGVKKESMMPKQFAELRGCGMILGKHQCSELRQGPAYLDVV